MRAVPSDMLRINVAGRFEMYRPFIFGYAAGHERIELVRIRRLRD